jgi:Smg protein
MFEVLVYLFETYYAAEEAPDQDTLSRKLSAAGFPSDDITDALDWLRDLAEVDEAKANPDLDRSRGTRVFSRTECAKLSAEARGFLLFLEDAEVLTPTVREVIIERALALEAEPVSLEQFKVIVLMVLWTRQGDLDSLVLEELLPDEEPRSVH